MPAAKRAKKATRAKKSTKAATPAAVKRILLVAFFARFAAGIVSTGTAGGLS